MPNEPILTPSIDNARRQKVFDVAKRMKSNCFKIRAVYFDDVNRWGIVCTSLIDGQLYDAANFLDDFTAKEHSDMFFSAFSDAMMEARHNGANGLILH